jgi:hypothetical protein
MNETLHLGLIHFKAKQMRQVTRHLTGRYATGSPQLLHIILAEATTTY